MKEVPFEPSTDSYDKQLIEIDKQICSLFKQRKDLSNNPGFPPDDIISKWALKYDLYEDYLRAIFWTLKMYDSFKTRIEPTGFRKHISVLQSVEKDRRVYSVTVIRQYENASVIQLHIDWDEYYESKIEIVRHHHNTFELILGEPYDCWQDQAGGSTGHFTYNFIISPPLPDDLPEMDFVFREYDDSHEKPTGLEIVI
ncbi:hypothetical protein [Bacillus massiliglaciei]|uniref:hypothetical protein n=1 Tax=Bacillus massiliglaciei TaxID=1816693 RepID=UPI000A462CE7|nr:hypothetical protein [Bacillus massiliglaciei]